MAGQGALPQYVVDCLALVARQGFACDRCRQGLQTRLQIYSHKSRAVLCAPARFTPKLALGRFGQSLRNWSFDSGRLEASLHNLMFQSESVHPTCRYLGLFGYALEWLLKACHSSSRLHTVLHRINTPKASYLYTTRFHDLNRIWRRHCAQYCCALQFHLLAITMVLAGMVPKCVSRVLSRFV